MAKKKNEKVIIEDIELKPQVIGYTYKKKSNLGRVIFTFVIFILVVFYINDISVFVNNLIGKDSAESIKNLTNNKEENKEEQNSEKNEVIFNVYDSNLKIEEDDFLINNFSLNDNQLSFDVVNTSKNTINYSDKKYFIETYSENKTLLERFKIDINSIEVNGTKNIVMPITSNFYYIVLSEKDINDYPAVSLIADETGKAEITCTKGIESIVYIFKENKLEQIKHTISDNDVTDADYYARYNYNQNKITGLNNLTGFTTTFNATLNGYTGVILIDLKQADLNNVDDYKYYAYNEEPKVVKFEMQTFGFNCN